MKTLVKQASLALAIISLGASTFAAGEERHSGRSAPAAGNGAPHSYGPRQSPGAYRGRNGGPYGFYGPGSYGRGYYGPGYYGPGYYGYSYYGPSYAYAPGYWDAWQGGWGYDPYVEYDYPPSPPPAYYAAPPPPPSPPAEEQAEPPAPEPAAERAFIVYFALDSAALSPAAKNVIVSAARYSAQNPGAAVRIVGYTDTSGSDAHNTELSEQRSKSVRAALIAAGVKNAEVDLDWKGKRDPAVKTADGVREPSNRRVTIFVAKNPNRETGQYGDDDQRRDADEHR